MTAPIFKYKAELLIAELETLIEQMPQLGNSAENSQKVLLQQKVNELQYAVNGVEDEDFKFIQSTN